MFQIVEIQPTHHGVTDAIIGSHVANREPYAYYSAALAWKIASILSKAEYDAYGDGYFVVVKYGSSPFDDRNIAPAPNAPGLGLSDEIPF